MNSRFKASSDKPISLYAGDFDGNGSVEQFSGYNGDQSYPMVLKHDLVSVLPSLKKKYLKYESYKGQKVEDIFTKEQLSNLQRLEAYRLESSVLLNRSREEVRDAKFTERSTVIPNVRRSGGGLRWRWESRYFFY